MKQFSLILAILAFLGLQVAFAQTREISGIVSSSDEGQPIPGATVMVKGTTVGVVTDKDGKFSLKVPADATTISINFVGMVPREVTLTSASNYQIQMESGFVAVDEVVVTALGISREKKSLGYASQGVKQEELMSANNANPLTSLSGKVAGLSISGQNFAGSQNILIRGASSFSGNNQPLFVVDGVPVSNESFNTINTQNGGGGYDYGSMISDLNSYDIASVEVLKGSAASALYGARGQNGVIMITTKSGKAGTTSFSVEVNSGITFENVSILPKQQTMYGGGYGNFKTESLGGKDYEIVMYDVDESWGPRYDPKRNVLHWWGVYDYEQGITKEPVTAPWVTPKNDVKSFYETGIAYQNSVNVVSNSENSALRVGYTNINRTGIVPNSSQDKNTLNVNGNTSILNGFAEINANVTYVYTYTKGRPQSGYEANSQSQKFFQWGQRSTDMGRLKNYMNKDGTQRTWNRTSLTDPTPAYSDNPYWIAYRNYTDDDRTRVFGTTGIKLNLTNHLSAQGSIYLDTYTFNIRERTAKGSQSQSRYMQAQRQATETNIEGKINYQRTFDVLDVSAFLGGNIRKNKYRRFIGESNGGLVIDNLYNLSNSVNQAKIDDYLRESRHNSVFASASVGYQSMIYLDATFRSDWDSSLPEKNNNYSYSSASGSFIISELIKKDWLNNLKARVNYGETGSGTSPYNIFNTYETRPPFQGNPQYTNKTRLNNRDLKPEITREVEFGLEGAVFNSRLGFDISLYNRNTENQIVPIEISGANGYTQKMINAGKINNKGIEAFISLTPVKTSDFAWEVNLNFAKNINTVKELPAEVGEKIQIASAPFAGALLNSVEGKTFQELYAYRYLMKDGKRVVNEETGLYKRGKLESVGSVLPDYTAGIKNRFKYKQFDLSALIDISKGGKYYSLTHMWAMYSGMDAKTATPTSKGNTIREDGLVLDGVLPDGSKNNIHVSGKRYAKSFYHGEGTPSESSIFDASYFKLREVTLGYTLPTFTDIFKSLRVSLYGRNLAVWGLDNKGIDPETVVGGNGNIQGLEGAMIPATRYYGFNIQIKL